MTKLEEEILKEIEMVPLIRREVSGLLGDDYKGYAQAAAQVALQWIEKALKDSAHHTHKLYGNDHGGYGAYYSSFKERWLSENGLTPSEPLKENT